MNDDIYPSEEEYQRALRYNRTREWLALVEQVTGWIATVALLFSGLSAAMRDRAEQLSPRRVPVMLLYTAMSSLLSFLVSLPLSYYAGHVVERQYGLTNQTSRGWLLDQLKGLGVGLVIGPPLAAGAHAVIRRRPRDWWLLLSAITVPLSAIFAQLAPVLLMPIFNRFEPLRDSALAERIRALAAREGVTVSQVLQMDMSRQTKKVNAMFTGLGATKRIVMGDTLLDALEPNEIEVVLAHELGHQVHRDIWKLLLLSAPLSALSLFTAHSLAPPVLRRYGRRWRIKGPDDVAALPLLTLLGGLAVAVVTPLLNGISRRFVEHRADVYALDLTKDREGFIGAMKKLGRINLANPRPSRLVKLLLYSHPPTDERIAFGRRYDIPE